MKIVYTFSDDEKRVVQEMYARYLSTLQVIANLHSITVQASITPDGSGFMVPDPEAKPDPFC